MTDLDQLEYPLKLCVEMLHYCAFSCEKTQELKASEIRIKLAEFFGDEMVAKAVSIVTGESKDN